MKVRILEPRRMPAAAGRVVLAAGGVALFLSAAMLFEPGDSRADVEGRPGHFDSAAGLTTESRGVSLGQLQGRDLTVTISATDHGPRYGVLDAMGNPVATDMHAEDVYREFPDLDVQTLQATPLMMAPEPHD